MSAPDNTTPADAPVMTLAARLAAKVSPDELIERMSIASQAARDKRFLLESLGPLSRTLMENSQCEESTLVLAVLVRGR